MKSTFSAERMIEAPADVIYHCIADYREHHRPEGFLPEAFSDIQIERGGVGAGTDLRWVVEVGGRRRTVTASVSEPDPGRILVEAGSGIETTFTVEPVAAGARVRFDTTLSQGGVQGVLNRLFAARLLRPIYEEELRRLDEHARAHGPLDPGSGATADHVLQHAAAGMSPSTALFESSGHPAGVPEAAERNAVLALGFIR